MKFLTPQETQKIEIKICRIMSNSRLLRNFKFLKFRFKQEI